MGWVLSVDGDDARTIGARLRRISHDLTVHYLYRVIANGSATGCAVVSPTAAQQFAAHFDTPGCPAATTQLTTQVTSPIKYAMAGSRSVDVYLGDIMTISSCNEIKPEGGPPLGAVHPEAHR
jgi:hypothetical protein